MESRFFRKSSMGKIGLWLVISMWLTIALSSFCLAEPGYSYDLSNAVVDVLAGSQITEVVADSERNIVYFGTIDGKLGYYNASSNSSTDLTSTISGFVSGEFYGMTLDTQDNRLYFTAGQVNNEVGYYELSSNTSTQLPLSTFTWFTKLQYDKERDVIWYASNDGDLGFISKLNNTKCPVGVAGGFVADICLDTYYNRLYVYYITSTKFPEYYAIDNQTQVDLSATHPMDINSCAIDQKHHRIYLGTPFGFDYQRIYFQLNDSVQPLYFSGDTAGTPKTVYMQHNDMVAFIEYSAFGDGMLFNLTGYINTYLQTTDIEDWMAPYFMDAGDYDNISNRLYIGFTGGGFGFYDNNYIYIYPLEYFNFSIDFTNHSNINLSNISNYPIVGRFVSGNESSLNITMYLNGSYEDSVIALNNTDFTLNINSINATGYYVVRFTAPDESLTFYFRVVNQSSLYQNPSPDYAILAISIILVGAVFVLAYLGMGSENQILRLLFGASALIFITGLFNMARLFSDSSGLNENITSMLVTMTIIAGLLSVFVIIYFVYILAVYTLTALVNLKKGGIKKLFTIKKENDDDIFK